MRKYVVFSCAVLVGAALLPLAIAADAPPMRGLIVNDTGSGYEGTAAKMEALGWTVGTISAIDLLEKDGATLRNEWDVVWTLPGADYELLRLFSKTGQVMDKFARAGGVVVILGVSTSTGRIDAGPGGLDLMPVADPGPTAVTNPDHLLVKGTLLGGANLTTADLDPGTNSGNGKLANPPGGCQFACILNNGQGSIMAEYDHGEGHVIFSLLELATDPCLDNVLRYATHLVHPN